MYGLKTLTTTLAALALSTSAALADTTPRLGHNLSFGGGEYTTGGGLTVVIEPRKFGGHLGLCGAWAQSDRLAVRVRRSARDVLSKGKVLLNGQVLTHDFGFLRQVRAAQDYTGKPAGCVKLATPWHPGFASARLDISIPRQKVSISDSGSRGGLSREFFKRSSNPNPALGKGSLLPANVTNPFYRTPLE